MPHSLLPLSISALCLACLAWMLPASVGTEPAWAGPVARGEAPIVLAQDDDPDAQQQADPSSSAALLVRIDRLENKLRTMTGQIEQLQFDNKKLEDALRKMQQDVDFRFQDLNRAPIGSGGKPPQRRGDLDTGGGPAIADAAPTSPDMPSATAPTTPASPPQLKRGGDAFDPSADPNAPGAPKPLGSAASEAPPPRAVDSTSGGTVARGTGSLASPAAPHAPLDLTHGLAPASQSAVASAVPEAPEASPVPPPPGGVASLAPGSTRAEYEADFALYKGGQYDSAVSGFSDFLNKYPHDRLVADATFFLGESYAKLGHQREAAEQFLKLSTDFTKSNRAPDALLRLGMTLNALGANAQACATYQEVDRKYPAASPEVRAGVDRELKRARC